MKRPGEILDSSKLAILGNKISGSIQQRTGGQYLANATVSGRVIKIKLKQVNPDTNKIIPITRNEQTLLAGRISSFLNANNISHAIKVI